MEKVCLVAGFGGQGVLLAAEVLANGFMIDDKNTSWYPSYGAEMRGGTVNCTVKVSEEEIGDVQCSKADYVIVLNQASFDKFESIVKSGGTNVVNTSLAKEKKSRNDINYVFLPITQLAEEKLGNIRMSNILALGVLSKVSKLISIQTIEKALSNVLPPHRQNLIPKNVEALKLGYEYDLLVV